MKAIIITIGDEILLGDRILDTNSQYISRQLTRLGARGGGYFVYCSSAGGDLAVGGLCDETGGTNHRDRGIGTDKG